MEYGLYFFAVYFAIGVVSTIITNLRTKNWDFSDIGLVVFWPYAVYFGVKFTTLKSRVNLLALNDVDGFCKLMKIAKIESSRDENARCHFCKITFKNGKEKTYSIYDSEVEDATTNNDNGAFFVIFKKMLLGKTK